jgi:hypothetical protein
MTERIIHTLALAIAGAAACCGTGAMAQVPAAVAAPGETTVATFQGEGARATMLVTLPAFLIPPLMSSCARVDDKPAVLGVNIHQIL